MINNAGTNIPEQFTKVQKKNMEYIVKLNTISTFHMAQLCALKMLESKNRKKIGGSIINMSSQMGHVGGPNRSVYNMTKFGLEGLTKGMAIDLAKHNVRVNTVCPTFVYTPMTKKFLRDKGIKKEEALALIVQGYKNILEEINKSLEYFSSISNSKVERIFLSGGGCLIHGIDDFIGNFLKIPAEILNPMQGVKINPKNFDKEMITALSGLSTVAIGLATRRFAHS